MKYGYFEQDFLWTDTKATPLKLISSLHPVLSVKEVRQQLHQVGLSSKQVLQTIGTLSGGEQAKLKMCLLTMTPCNFLVLDEPTNHLDAHAKEALKTALQDFSGTVLLVSHEEAFYRDWIQKIIPIEQ